MLEVMYEAFSVTKSGPKNRYRRPSMMSATANVASSDIDVRSRPRSGRMNSNWIATPITNITGTVISSPTNRSMCRWTEST